MYIKSIKIQGFKSFADKTELNFDKDISAIVGPNGSGKSNIVDALLWVLGEQSVKTLRGEEKMSDIIFSGSKTRDSLNKASVSILFNNSDHTLNSEFNDVEIKRTIYKTGENEYFINNSKVRLKDITNLLTDVSSKFNIITQGNINALVDNKSFERRALFENAAGVLKYKKRKEETLKKLENTKENITRLDLIIKEVLTTLKPLEKQKKDAEKYLKIKGNLENIECSLIVNDITKYKNSYDELKNKNEVLTKKQEFLSPKRADELEDLKLELIKIDDKISEYNNQIIQINDDIARLQGEKQINLERVKLSVNQDKINENLLVLKEEKLTYEKKIDVLQNEINLLKETYNNLIKEFNDKNNEELKQKIKITTLKADYNVKSKELLNLENKINIIKTNLENNLYLPKSVNSILSSTHLKGIHNTIGNIINVNEAHNVAISMALGASSNFIVTSDFDSAKKAINYLKENRLGRATFFPLDIIKSRYISLDILNKIKNIDGFIGIASDLVEYDTKYKNIIENQLGNVIIVNSLNDLQIVGKILDFKYKVVSLEGDIIYPGGAVSGGENKTISDDKIILAKLQSEYNDKKGLLESINTTLENKISSHDKLLNEITNINSKIVQNRIIIENKEKNILELKDKLSYVENNIKGFDNLNNNTLNDVIENILKTLNNKSKEKEIIENNISDLRSKKFDISEKIESTEKEINEINTTYNKNINDIKNNEIEIGKLEVKIDSLLNALQNEYNMSYENALTKFTLNIDENEAREIVYNYKNEIKTLNNINVGSISEYDRLKTRYDFLDNQKTDLESSSTKLYEIIDEMDDIMKKRFKATFDEISKEFSICFRKMFKGGNGVLKLTDENDLLNTGISILAVPPGKKLNSTAALSGGEKALTAICLIFAILNVKPAPFVVLDEVEAPLDEENVIMFGDYLKSMKNTSQFILITHKKKMMEYASKLYGVTMEESGVSKLVSVRLENNIN
ncbi:MAG: AAA family ATPase [bacterium]|nr:AAA family ATPase [bacterium]